MPKGDDSTVGMFQPTRAMVKAAQKGKAKPTPLRVKRTSGQRAELSIQLGAAKFSAEGPADEVMAKFHRFMEETFEQPMQSAIAGAKKGGGK